MGARNQSRKRARYYISGINVLTIAPNLPDCDTEFLALVEWMKRVEALPGFDAAYPPHWREAA